MNNWVQHEKKWGGKYMPIPATRQGHGYSVEDVAEPGKEFTVDEKTGLLLPEAAASARRKVRIGFQPKKETA